MKHCYARYGGRGIEMRLTLQEIELLWNRDAAGSMKKPSIDRINSDGHYELSNCRFIERQENSRLGAISMSKCLIRHPGIAPQYKGQGCRLCKAVVNSAARRRRTAK